MAEQGIGVKIAIGFGLATDIAEVERIRAAVGDSGRLMVDALWSYQLADAVRLGRALENHRVDFFESPLAPEDIDGHARLAQTLDIAVAVGEPLRTRFAFLPWLQSGALDIAQPDVMRNGITESARIAELAGSFNLPVALHTGCLTVVGMAATWQLAAALPNSLIQEFQPVMLETFNPWLDQPFEFTGGRLPVPTGPGLGITLDPERMLADVDSVVTVDHA